MQSNIPESLSFQKMWDCDERKTQSLVGYLRKHLQFSEWSSVVIPEDFHQLSASLGKGQVVSRDHSTEPGFHLPACQSLDSGQFAAMEKQQKPLNGSGMGFVEGEAKIIILMGECNLIIKQKNSAEAQKKQESKRKVLL
jgi:hypothetical protein